MLADAQRVHMVGIAGSGMAALASLLLQMGKRVTGSDVAGGPTVQELRSEGATIALGHAAANVPVDADYVIRSSAVPNENPEVVAANAKGITTHKLAEAVGELMHGKSGVAVAGTHGKTTTTALVTWLLDQGGVDPLALIGADTPTYRHGARNGDGPMVVEADEYDRRFLQYWPEVAVVTSVEPDHLDYYADLTEIRSAFAELVGRIPAHGRLVVCADEPCAASLDSKAGRETYGFASDATWRIENYGAVGGRGTQFTVSVDGRTWSIESPLVGRHNARNVAAAFAVADYFGVGVRVAAAALTGFKGPRRRFEIRGRPRGVSLVDDYGHHPTEVAAVLGTARSVADGAVWIVFQPHTVHRTRSLFNEFARSFGDADHALLLPIYRPSGRDVEEVGVSSPDLVEAIIQDGHRDARYVESFDAATEIIAREVAPGDLVLTMGAGDVTQLADRLLAELE